MPIYPPFPAKHASTHDAGQSDDVYLDQGNGLTAGIETADRPYFNNAQIPASNYVFFSYFTAPFNYTANNIVIVTGGTAGVGAQNHFLLGLYTVNSSGDLVLVANTTDNAVTLSINTDYSVAMTSGEPYTLLRGQRYAGALLVAYATSRISLMGSYINQVTSARTPRITSSYTNGSPTSLPASVTQASGNILSSYDFYYMAFI